MGTPYLGELKLVAFNFPPKGWTLANGQFLPINQNQALFSLFGTMYGGNGQTTFALPDMRSRAPIHVGSGFSTQGEKGGEEFHTVTQSEMPQHIHFANATNNNGTSPSPGGNVYGKALQTPYGTPISLAVMNAGTVSSVGGSQPHENRQPFLVLNWIVALQGVFPSRN